MKIEDPNKIAVGVKVNKELEKPATEESPSFIRFLPKNLPFHHCFSSLVFHLFIDSITIGGRLRKVEIR